LGEQLEQIVEMFDFFSSPADRILNRIPVHAHSEFWSLKHLIERDEGFGDIEKPYLAGCVLAAWACRSARVGKIQLSHSVYNQITNIGTNCRNQLTLKWQRIDGMINALVKRGLIPDI